MKIQAIRSFEPRYDRSSLHCDVVSCSKVGVMEVGWSRETAGSGQVLTRTKSMEGGFGRSTQETMTSRHRVIHPSNKAAKISLPRMAPASPQRPQR